MWTKSFVTLFITNMVFNMGMSMSLSLLSVYADSMGASASAIGMLVGGYAISSILLRPFAASFIDSFNRKYIVIASCLMEAISFLGYSVSTNVAMLLVFRLIQGCGVVFGNACCLVIAADMLPKETYSSGIGYYSLAQNISQAVAPYVGLWLMEATGFQTTYRLTASVMFLAAILATQIGAGGSTGRRFQISLAHVLAREAILPASMIMIMNIGGTAVTSFLIIFATGRGVGKNIGLYFLISAGAMLATRPLIGRLTDRFGIVYVCIPAFFVTIVSYIVISGSKSLVGFIAAAVITAFGQGACLPAMQALSMKAVPRERRGAASSTNYIGLDLGYLIGPLVAGRVVEAFGYVTMWYVMGIPFVIGMVILYYSKSRINETERRFAGG